MFKSPQTCILEWQAILLALAILNQKKKNICKFCLNYFVIYNLSNLVFIIILDITILFRIPAVLKKLLPAAPFFVFRDIDEVSICILHFRFVDVQPGSFSSMGDKIQKYLPFPVVICVFIL